MFGFDLLRSKLKREISIIFGLILCLTFLASASAQSREKLIGQSAIELAETIKQNNLTIEMHKLSKLIGETEETKRRLALHRIHFINAIYQSIDPKDLKKISNTYQIDSTKNGTFRDKEVAKLFNIVTEYYSLDPVEEETKQLRDNLEPFLKSSDWFVKYNAKLLQSSFDYEVQNLSLALSSIQESLALIPQENSLYAQEAKILILSDSAYIYNYLKVPKLAIEHSNQLISEAQKSNLPIDGYSVVNNFIYSFTAWRDFETANALGEILLELENSTTSETPGLTQMRLASINNELGNYDKALEYATIAINNSDYQPVKKSAKYDYIIALAGLGQTAKAQAEIDKLISKSEDVTELSDRHIVFAEALIAVNENSPRTATRLFNQRLTLEIQNVLSKNNSETGQLIASLHDTADRRSEREAAFEREAKLKAEALLYEQQKNRLMISLGGLLVLSLIGLSIHLRWRVKTARQLAEAAEMALIGEQTKARFLAVASHELRTPLNGVIGISQHLSQTAPTEDLREKNQLILQCGQDLLMTVENMLDMTIIQGQGLTVYPEVMELPRVIQQLEQRWRPVIEQKNIIFTIHLDKDIPQFLFLDRKRIYQSLEVLLSNAAKFTLEGRIHIHITSEPIDKDGITHELKIIVADTGDGIANDNLEKMFEPFVQADSSMTRKYGGSGLGLSVLKYLTDKMDGSIDVRSKLGRGTEIILKIPAKASQVVQQKIPASQPTAQDRKSQDRKLTLNTKPAIAAEPLLHRRHVLIVEDDPTNQQVLKSFLEPEGCTITCLADGTDVIKTLSQKSIDLILMDVRMPIMDGIETTKQIRQSGQAFSGVPIIAITADPAPSNNALCMAAGADLFLKKPVNAKGLFEAIRFVMIHKPELGKPRQSLTA